MGAPTEIERLLYEQLDEIWTDIHNERVEGSTALRWGESNNVMFDGIRKALAAYREKYRPSMECSVALDWNPPTNK